MIKKLKFIGARLKSFNGLDKQQLYMARFLTRGVWPYFSDRIYGILKIPHIP